jgi:hypothetical protein
VDDAPRRRKRAWWKRLFRKRRLVAAFLVLAAVAFALWFIRSCENYRPPSDY